MRGSLPGAIRIFALSSSLGVAALGASPGKHERRTPARPAKHAARAAPRRAPSSKSTSKPPEFPPDATDSKAYRYARLGADECLEELERRSIGFRKESPSPGVLIPVRLLGPVSGVLFRTDFPDARRSRVPFEIFDCRLVLALSDFGRVLSEHGIDEVRMFSAWRPPAKSWPEGKLGQAHPGGLAADLRLFKKSDGETLEVETDFHGRLGAVPCGPAAVPPSPTTPAATELRAILCAAAESRLFHVLLSPNFDEPHRNHFHVEVRPDVRWFIVR